MDQTGQAKNPFPLTRILLVTQSLDSVNNWISGGLVLKLILIRAETPFLAVIVSFSTFGRFRCCSASYSKPFGGFRAILVFIKTWLCHSLCLSGKLISDNSPSFVQEVANATQIQFTHVYVLIILAMCVWISFLELIVLRLPAFVLFPMLCNNIAEILLSL